MGVGASVLGSHLRTYGWVKDEDVSECMNACGTEFSALERRHHCRCVQYLQCPLSRLRLISLRARPCFCGLRYRGTGDATEDSHLSLFLFLLLLLLFVRRVCEALGRTPHTLSVSGSKLQPRRCCPGAAVPSSARTAAAIDAWSRSRWPRPGRIRWTRRGLTGFVTPATPTSKRPRCGGSCRQSRGCCRRFVADSSVVCCCCLKGKTGNRQKEPPHERAPKTLCCSAAVCSRA